MFIYSFFIALSLVSCSKRHNTEGIMGKTLNRSEVLCGLPERVYYGRTMTEVNEVNEVNESNVI